MTTAAVVLVACSGGPGGNEVSISPTTSSIVVGDTQQFTARAFERDGSEVPPEKIAWATSNVLIATIDERGLAKGVAAGIAQISASYGGSSSTLVSLMVAPRSGSPGVTTELTAQAARAAITLTWKANPSNEEVTSYVVRHAAETWSEWGPSLQGAGEIRDIPCCTATVTSLPVAVPHFFSVAAVNPRGQGPTSTVISATPLEVELQWATRANLPSVRYDLGAAVVAGKLYAIGGDSGSLHATNEMYDPETNTWTPRAPMPTPRASLVVAAVSGKIYAIGGRATADPNQPLSVLNEEYDPATDTWRTRTPVPASPSPRSCLNTAGAAANGKIYIWNGTCSSPPAMPIYEYDPSTNAWATKSAAPSFMARDHVLVPSGASLYGLLPQGGQETVFIHYSAPSDTWTFKAPLKQLNVTSFPPVWAGIAATFQTVYAFGHQNQKVYSNYPDEWVSRARYFDPIKNGWNETNGMPTPRDAFATAIINDKIYVVGGTVPLSQYSSQPVPLGALEVATEVR